MRNSLLAASILSLVVLLTFSWRPIAAFAADQGAAILQAMQGLQASVNDLRVQNTNLQNQISSIRLEVKNNQTASLKRSSDGAQKTATLSDTVRDLDSGNQVETISSLASRTSVIEAAYKRQVDDHESLMASIHPAVTTAIASSAGFICVTALTALMGWRHRHKVEAALASTGRDVKQLEINTNHKMDELIAEIRAKAKLEVTASRAEGVIEGRDAEKAGS